ncbi:MAG: S41 family peptidase [Bacteroidales bacterium]|jgi:carboxyl-terminal processing protease|nr:S41 family peptidase [Bacteroidales bacterium]
MNFKLKIRQNTGFQLFIALFFIFSQLYAAAQQRQEKPILQQQKMQNVLQLIDFAYVDVTDLEPLVEKATVEMLKQLDPHSVYISKKDVERANEPLVGNFDGIGVSFQIFNDTVTIIDVIAGGPSEKLGILPGDKIVRIDSLNATGDSATTNFIFSHLRGKKGTHVMVYIKRDGIKDALVYDIIRDKIPIYSVDTYFMEDSETGYLRLDRFARNSMDEIRKALEELKVQGMKNLILDLRGNSGGFMDVAVDLADEFLSAGKMVVYMQGKAMQKEEFKSTAKGSFESGRLVVMIDEGSASASEIVSGAIQDHDRGLIVGRRSFGKGLVQRPFDLVDKSQIRLTTARYYTPSGRSIQKPYADGLGAYYSDIMRRYEHGEMVHPDSMKIADSMKYYTSGKRVVYGGGGIMPDLFIPVDTQLMSDYYVDLRRKGVINKFVMDKMNDERKKLLRKYLSFNDFQREFKTDEIFMDEFYAFAEKEGVVHKNFKKDKGIFYVREMMNEMLKDTMFDTVQTYREYVLNILWSNEKMQEFLQEKAAKEDSLQQESVVHSDRYLQAQLKATLARNLYGIRYYYESIKDIDEGYKIAVRTIRNEELFNNNGIR